MHAVSSASPASNWDIRRGPTDGSRAGVSAWVEQSPALTLARAFYAQPEFWEHVEAIRRDPSELEATARLYIPRDQGRRVELLETYLLEVAQRPAGLAAKVRLYGFGTVAYAVDGEPSPGAPRRALRLDALATLEIGALRVARRGAGRCAAGDCPEVGGRHLSGGSGHCWSCESKRAPSLLAAEAEAERTLLTAAVAAVLGDRPTSRARRRRVQRAPV